MNTERPSTDTPVHPATHRVATLRAELQRLSIDGFLVPHADEYQNEYLPACAERLAWLTGFTGSAGLAVVLKDRAAIFVDGRYTLQVRDQVDLEIFTPLHLTETPVHTWLPSVLSRGWKLAYDPWLHSAQEVEILRESCERAGAAFVPLEPNPIDQLWTSRPPAPRALVKIHLLQYAGLSSSDKRRQLGKKLKDQQAEAAVLTSPDSIAWLLNIRGGDVEHTPLPLSFAVLWQSGAVDLFISDEKVTGDVRDYLQTEATIFPPAAFSRKLEDLSAQRKKVMCDYGKTAAWVVDRLTEHGAIMVKGDDPCVLPKACKNAVEIQGAREAHRRDAVAVCRFLAWLAEAATSGSVTELDAQAYLDARRKEQPFWQDLSFPTISGAGPHGAIVHYRASARTNRKLEPGTLYLVDSGAQYVDGTTDITRTVAIGTPSAEHRDRYTRVLKGHIALATARFPKGTSGAQLDSLARHPLWEAGLDYDHGTGHGVGSYLGVHEGPQRIAKAAASVPLEPGMIVSNEPGYYKAGEFGIRIENLQVVVGCDGHGEGGRTFLAFEPLTLVPLDTTLIEPALLTPQERGWINTYHRRVREALEARLDSKTAEWLRQATRPV